jgi:hypothetical protein
MKLLTGGSRDAASRVSTFATAFRLAIFISLAISATAQDHAIGTAKPVTMTGLAICTIRSRLRTRGTEFFDQDCA